MPSTIADALIRQSWLGVQRHIYAAAWHGTAASLPAWEAFVWQHFERRFVLVCSRGDGPSSVGQLFRFVAGLDCPMGTVLVETCPELDGDLEAELRLAGWKASYDLPGHVIPTNDEWRERLALANSTVKVVNDESTLADFAYVQDQAYRESYDWPRGCASLFYSDLRSVCGPDTIAHVLYLDGRPVRAAQLVRAGGLVHGVAGAAVSAVRGRHLGETLMYTLTEAARDYFGASEVLHFTMPVARPIAARLGLAQVAKYTRWSRP